MRITGGKFKGRVLASPKTDKTRPTSDRNRESLFNILTHEYHDYLNESAVLDLFAGTGSLGIEALSRGANYCVFVEKTTEAYDLVRQNIERLKIQEQSKVLKRDATKMGSLSANMKPFNLLFLDPPYSLNLAEKALESLWEGRWLQSRALCVIEESSLSHFTLNSNFVVLEERIYGKTIIRFAQVI